MGNKPDFFQKKLSNTRSFVGQKKKSHTWIWIIVIVLLLWILWLLWWKLFWAPVSLNGYDEEDNYDTMFSLWDEVHLQWEIKMEGTSNPYTIEDLNYWKFGIQSDSISFYDYVWWYVDITGVVIKKPVQSYPIIRVFSLSWTLVWANESDTNMVLDDNSGVYILWAWIQFLPSFFDEYVLLNEWENWEIRIQHIETWEEIVLNYFRCNSSDPNKNCKWLTENFANNNAQSFVTSEWDVFYKLSEVQSWFVANGNRWWVFINDVSDDEVFKLKDLIKFANERNMNEWIKSRAMKICQWSWEKLQNIKNSEIALKQEWLVVTVSGDGKEKQMTCQILVDFSLPYKWELQSLTLWDDVVASEEEEQEETKNEEEKEDEKTDEWQISATVFDTNVPQFPIKEEWLAYKSARWGYVLKFPSSNISYSVSSVKENFGRNDVNCSYVINVIKYSEKENLEISPAIRIYECDWSVENSWAQGIIVYPRLDRKFVVQMNDGAWNDFSMNLKFEEFVEE